MILPSFRRRIAALALLSTVIVSVALYGLSAKLPTNDPYASRRIPDPTTGPPQVITIVFSPKVTAIILRNEEHPTSRLRVAAHVTEVLPNGRMKIEAQWTTTDGDQEMHQSMSGVVRSNAVGKDDAVMNGDEVAQLRFDTRVVPEVDSSQADL